MEKGYYQLTCDDDGHWYVIPANLETEFVEYLRSVYAYYRNMPDDVIDAPEPPMPEWVTPVGGFPGMVKFRVWWLEGRNG